MEQTFQPYPETKTQKIKRFLKETYRVLRITKKPSKEEFRAAAKSTALGTAIIGAVGFLIFLIKQLLFE